MHRTSLVVGLAGAIALGAILLGPGSLVAPPQRAAPPPTEAPRQEEPPPPTAAPPSTPLPADLPLVPTAVEVAGGPAAGEARGPFAVPRSLEAPEGIRIQLFASGLGSPRFLAAGPAGELYVTVPAAGRVLRLEDRDGDGFAERIGTFAGGLDRPHGIALRGGEVWVAENARVSRLPDGDGDGVADRAIEVTRDLPPGGGHWTRTIGFGPDGALYVAAGSSCNACREEDPRRAAVQRFAPASGAGAGGGVEREGRIHATGLRNAVGLAWHPDTGELWATENGRDNLGDDLPPDEINRVTAGGDYGWPACYGDRLPDPGFGDRERCARTVPPAVPLQAHSAPLGLAFGHRASALPGLPAAWRDDLYVALHGSWNRSEPTGYKVVRVPFDAAGRPEGGYEDFLRGWLVRGGAWGRPVDVAVGPDGALYVSDDRAGAIYRLTAPANTPGRARPQGS